MRTMTTAWMTVVQLSLLLLRSLLPIADRDPTASAPSTASRQAD